MQGPAARTAEFLHEHSIVYAAPCCAVLWRRIHSNMPCASTRSAGKYWLQRWREQSAVAEGALEVAGAADGNAKSDGAVECDPKGHYLQVGPPSCSPSLRLSLRLSLSSRCSSHR